MDIFFSDPPESRLPPEQVRLREVRVTPSDDGRRARIYLEVDPFQKRPDLDLWLHSAAGEEVAQTSIIQTMARKMELTMHIRQPQPGGEYSLRVVLYATQLPAEPDPSQEMGGIQRQATDEKTIRFTLPEALAPAGSP